MLAIPINGICLGVPGGRLSYENCAPSFISRLYIAPKKSCVAQRERERVLSGGTTGFSEPSTGVTAVKEYFSNSIQRFALLLTQDTQT